VESRAGWAELRAGRWEAAREAFAAAEETAASLEGLSWAAWWLDDADAGPSEYHYEYLLVVARKS